ncbi:MAG: DUF99 family protein [Thiotrichaceae bacterium]|nr:DUF99 family protein [Thiotrichaceae bacterium]
MKPLSKVLQQQKRIRVLGIDDAPFNKQHDDIINFVGIVCSNTRFEGMLWNEADRDGTNATDAIIQMVKKSKFHQQLHLILIDGIAIGGFNIIDLPRLSKELSLPCLAVMRKLPDLAAIDRALQHFNDYDERIALIKNAGEIYQRGDFVYQVAGCSAASAEQGLQQTTDRGKVPEALRLAHLIGAAVKTGESSHRA